MFWKPLPRQLLMRSSRLSSWLMCFIIQTGVCTVPVNAYGAIVRCLVKCDSGCTISSACNADPDTNEPIAGKRH